MTVDDDELTAEEAEARARKLRLKYELDRAVRQRDAPEVLRIEREDEVVRAEQLVVRLRQRQQEVARFRTSLAEVSILAAAAAAAVGSIAREAQLARQLFGFAALSFFFTSVLSLVPYALAISRRKPRCERFGKFDLAGLSVFLVGIILMVFAIMHR